MSGWPSQADEERETEARIRDEQDRRTIAELLMARGQDYSAGLVAAARYSTECVDNWNGGVFDARLTMPVALYDRVGDEQKAEISAAAEAVIGSEHFGALAMTVQREQYRTGWDEELLNALRERVTSQRAADGGPPPAQPRAPHALPASPPPF